MKTEYLRFQINFLGLLESGAIDQKKLFALAKETNMPDSVLYSTDNKRIANWLDEAIKPNKLIQWLDKKI